MLPANPYTNFGIALLVLVGVEQGAVSVAAEPSSDKRAPQVKTPATRPTENLKATKALLVDARINARYQLRSAREHIQEWRSDRRVATRQ